MKTGKRILFLSVIFLLIPYFSALGVETYEDNVDFTPNQIVSDSDMVAYDVLTVDQVKLFLKDQGGTLADYIDPETNLPAYQIIWQAGQDFKISPKFLITLIQKEQSLATDPSPKQSQYDWATGYSCYGGVCLDIYRGLARQVQAAAKKFRSYLDDLEIPGKYQDNFYCTFTKWCLGKPKETQDRLVVLPQSKATAALYTYNPYRGNTVVDGYKIGANYNFWKIWQAWFKGPNNFWPDGSLLKTAARNTVYLVQNGLKRPFATFNAFISRFDPKDISIVSQAEIDNLPEGPAIKFSQYSLLANPSKEIFLLVDDTLRKFSALEVFRTLGFNPEEVIEVSDEDLKSVLRGEDLTLSSSYPTGALIQDSKSGGVYFVQNGVKRPIFAKEILTANFPQKVILRGHTKELAQYQEGQPVKFKDGALVKAKNDDKVYVIASGQRWHIKDEAAFISRGYKWQNIIEINDQAMAIHQDAEALDTLATTTTSQLELIKDESENLEKTAD